MVHYLKEDTGDSAVVIPSSLFLKTVTIAFEHHYN
jgi:hypothetical protein